MKQSIKCQRILILSLIFIFVLAPIILFSVFTSSFVANENFVEDLSTIKYKTDTLKLRSLRDRQELGEDFNEPVPVVYVDQNLNSVVRKQVQSNKTTVRRELNGKSQPRSASNEKVREIKDQLLRAKAYLNFAQPNNISHITKELKLRIKEVERALGDARKDSDLSTRVLQRMRNMADTLLEAEKVYTDCSAMATKLRAMTYNTEQHVRAQQNQATYLLQLAARTISKGLHCLSIRLTAEYFSLLPEERTLPNQHNLHDPDLYHYVVFSDNILACTVVVNSTISASTEPETIVFHIVTDTLKFRAMVMWFFLNPLGQGATIDIKSIDDFEWHSSKFGSTLKKQESLDPRYTSVLNHLRFYLPDLFPKLNKIVLLDHDVVVQKDLRGLWSVNMRGKVNGAVETCQEDDLSYRQMDMLINFSDPLMVKKFDVKTCTWAFGVNIFDLREWRRHDLTDIYHKYLELGKKKKLWKSGSLPLGLVTFYNQTVGLDKRWHVLGLGYEWGGDGRTKMGMEEAAVIHYDGNLKPWLEIGVRKYKGYWNKYVNYEHPYLQQCNIHD